MPKITEIKLWLYFKAYEPLKDFFLRIWYCHHNAKVIADFEDRMTSVIYHATNGMMSKPYYDKQAMISMIDEAFNKHFEEGYKEGQENAKNNSND